MPLESSAILSPILRLNEELPSLLLPEVMSPDSSNVNLRDGEIHSALMRRAEPARIPNRVNPPVFTGTGTTVMTTGGTFTGSADIAYKVVVDADATPDTFEWFKDSVSQASGVAITGSAQTLDLGVTVTFDSTTNADLNDQWDFTATFHAEILHYHEFEKGTGSRYLFAFTKDCAYRHNPASTVNTEVFTGSGLDDLTAGGTFTGGANITYTVKIDGTGTPDTFKWSKDGGSTWEVETVNIDGTAQTLDLGVTVTFGATTGHTLNDLWTIECWASSWDAWLDSNVTDVQPIGPCTYWSTATQNDVIIATNNVDKLLVGDDADDFDFLGSSSGLLYATSKYVTKAAYVDAFENYVVLLGTTEDGTTYHHRRRWSDLADHETWDSGDADFADQQGEGKALIASAQKGNFLYVAKDRSLHRVWLTSSTDIFHTEEVLSNVGIAARGSFIHDDAGRLYFLGSDNGIREVDDGIISGSLEKTMRELPTAYIELAKAAWIVEYRELWFAVPSTSGATANNLVLCYNSKYRVWDKRVMPAVAFGRLETTTTYTYETLPFTTYDEWSWPSYDSVQGQSGQRVDICSDNSGYTYEAHGSALDNGSAITASFQLASDVTREPSYNLVKRVHWMRLFFRGESTGTVTVNAKLDHETSWTQIGTVSVAKSQAIFDKLMDVDFLTKHLELQMTSDDRFRFLGLIFQYTRVGLR